MSIKIKSLVIKNLNINVYVTGEDKDEILEPSVDVEPDHTSKEDYERVGEEVLVEDDLLEDDDDYDIEDEEDVDVLDYPQPIWSDHLEDHPDLWTSRRAFTLRSVMRSSAYPAPYYIMIGARVVAEARDVTFQEAKDFCFCLNNRIGINEVSTEGVWYIPTTQELLTLQEEVAPSMTRINRFSDPDTEALEGTYWSGFLNDTKTPTTVDAVTFSSGLMRSKLSEDELGVAHEVSEHARLNVRLIKRIPVESIKLSQS